MTTKKELEKIAEDLPKAYRFSDVKVKGVDLLNDPKFKVPRDKFLAGGGKINSSYIYTIENFNKHEINHFKKLQQAYNALGRLGVAKYILPYTDGEYRKIVQADIDRMEGRVPAELKKVAEDAEALVNTGRDTFKTV